MFQVGKRPGQWKKHPIIRFGAVQPGKSHAPLESGHIVPVLLVVRHRDIGGFGGLVLEPEMVVGDLDIEVEAGEKALLEQHRPFYIVFVVGLE